MLLLSHSGSAVRRTGLLHSSTIVSCQRVFRSHYGQLPVVGSPAARSSGTRTATPPPLPTSSDQTLPSPHHTESQLSIYEGPFSQTAMRLKLFSVSSLAATIALCPFIFILDAGISNGMRGGLAVAAVATSGSSTALVQWCLGSYVRKVTIPNPACATTTASAVSSSSSTSPSSGQPAVTITRSTPVSFETLSFFGGKRITTVKVSDLEPSSAPFSTIRIRAGQRSVARDTRGRILSDGNQSTKRFYLHTELTEEEPLRTIMAEIQQNSHLTTAASATKSSAAASSAFRAAAQENGGEAGSQTSAPVTEGMSDRIEQLKRKVSENARKEHP
ncbi:hypothetical protein EDD11_005082 [Mortierella claussenii]|nr:hypothetical protein EDD11_005082 [Mortierella claussenii]